MKTQTVSRAVNHELAARIGNQPKQSPKPGTKRKDYTAVIAVAIISVIPAAIFALVHFHVINANI